MQPPRFQPRRLFQAIDQERCNRGWSWAKVSETTGVAASTIRRLDTEGRFEVDGVLFLVSWLGTSLETFVDGRPTATDTRIPRGRFHGPLLDAAIKKRCTDDSLSLDDVMAATHVDRATVKRFATPGRFLVEDVIAVAAWLGYPVSHFTHAGPAPERLRSERGSSDVDTG